MDYQNLSVPELQKIHSMVQEELKNRRVHSPLDMESLLKKYAKKTVEYFLVVTFNGNHIPIKVHEITKGLVNRTMMHPREVFRAAIKDNAVSIIVAHNHPSGSLEFSCEDKGMFKRLKDAGEILGINVLDSMIISKTGYASDLENNQ